MTTRRWRRATARMAVILSLMVIPLVAQGWAAASHAWMAKTTFKRAGLTDANELCNRLYGANAVDLFNTDFTWEGQVLSRVLHDRAQVVSAIPWELAEGDAELAFAYGFASHNELWGTDATAHYAARTLEADEGFVIARAAVMAALIRDAVLPLVGGDEAMLLFVSHILTEHAIDLLLAGDDPSIPFDMMASAYCPEPAGVQVLVDSLVPVFAPFVGEATAEELLRAGEPQFAYGLFVNGWALAQPDPVMALAGLIAYQARGFLPGPLPEDPVLVPLIAQVLQVGMFINAADFRDELEATRGWVNGRMSSLGISP